MLSLREKRTLLTHCLILLCLSCLVAISGPAQALRKGKPPKEPPSPAAPAIVLGAELNNPQDDYPVFAKLVGDALAAGRASRGVLICGSAISVMSLSVAEFGIT